MKKSNVEFKVGVFVLVSLGILTYLVAKAGDFSFKPGYTIRMVFAGISGIDSGTPVRLAGVPVGEVKNIQVVRGPKGDTQVEVTAWIAQGAFIEDDAEVRISGSGLLGEKYIDITPGTAGNKTIGDGGVLPGQPPASLDTLAQSADRLIGKIDRTFESINQIVDDAEFQQSVRGTFANADSAFQSASFLLADLKEASADLKDAATSARVVLARLRDGEGTIGKLLKEDKIAKNLEAFTEDIKAHPWKLLKRG